jgi:hypothetical protein
MSSPDSSPQALYFFSHTSDPRMSFAGIMLTILLHLLLALSFPPSPIDHTHAVKALSSLLYLNTLKGSLADGFPYCPFHEWIILFA